MCTQLRVVPVLIELCRQKLSMDSVNQITCFLDPDPIGFKRRNVDRFFKPPVATASSCSSSVDNPGTEMNLSTVAKKP